MDRPAVAELMAGVAAAVSRRAAAVHDDVYEVILRDIPELREDTPVLALLRSSVQSNFDTCLQVLQHQIDLADVQAPAMAVEYARRQAQRGMPLTVLLRACRFVTAGADQFGDQVARGGVVGGVELHRTLGLAPCGRGQ